MLCGRSPDAVSALKSAVPVDAGTRDRDDDDSDSEGADEWAEDEREGDDDGEDSCAKERPGGAF
jgi:hypothetical protein